MGAASGLARRARRRLDAHRPAAHLGAVEAFAVDDRSVQVVWGRAPAGPVRVAVRVAVGVGNGPVPGGPGGARREVVVVGGDGPGGVVVDGLEPGLCHDVEIEAVSSERRRLQVRTLVPPPGDVLCRVATVSDLHIGAVTFGLLHSMVDRSGHPEPTALRCARRALRDATAWGAELLVMKGDVTNHGWHSQWATVRSLVATTGLPTVLTAGNHDVEIRREIDMAGAVAGSAGAADEAPGIPISLAAPLHVADLPGLRVVTVDSSRDTHSTGSLRDVLADLLDALAEADRPALVCLHHCLDRWPLPTKYPRGITWPESARALAAIRRVKSDVVVTSGHSHRNRARRVGPLVVSEVGSTKDYPGVWAGYAAYEGGIVQVVRRTTAPDAMEWVEYSRQAVGGAWRWYAPGRLDDRCFSHSWPARPGRTGDP